MMKNRNLIFFFIGLAFVLFVSEQGNTQTVLTIGEGYLVQDENSILVLNNTQFVNHGTFKNDVGTVLISGDVTNQLSAIGGDSISVFNDLQIDKSNHGVELQQNIIIGNKLLMDEGVVDLNGDTITLESNAIVEGENADNRIIGPNGGVVQINLPINAPNLACPGNLGFCITSTENLGNTLIQREHLSQSINSNNNIARKYRIVPSNNSDLDATIQFAYFESELNGNNEADLDAWRRDSSFWYNPIFVSPDTVNNIVQVDSINFLSEWTLAASAPKLDLRVFLAGPYDDPVGEMSDDLRVSDHIPTTEPYTNLGYLFPASGGGEQVNPLVFDRSDHHAIVDWVVVELRDALDPSSIIAARSALLQKDGDVVDLDGISYLSFPEVSKTTQPLITIRHRNHLGIIAASTVDLSQAPNQIDFSTSPMLVAGGTAALQDLGNGRYGLISGDFDGDGQIQNTDINAQTLTLGSSGYLPGDSDLNGQVQNTDLQIKLTPNLGRGSQFTY